MKLGKVTVKVKLDTREARQQLNKLSRSFKTLGRELNRLEKRAAKLRVNRNEL